MKKFVSMALALTVAASMAVPAFAASEPVAPQNEPTAATESVSPCIYWTGTAMPGHFLFEQKRCTIKKRYMYWIKPIKEIFYRQISAFPVI